MTTMTIPGTQNFCIAKRKSRIDRFGVFAEEPIPRRRKIGHLAGDVVSVAQIRRLVASQERIAIVELDAKRALDATQSKQALRYANHSCDPNAYIRVMNCYVEFYSIRPIFPNEEITVDYRYSHHEGTRSCKCQAVNCRGYI
jgi:SET domain-containing protein